MAIPDFQTLMLPVLRYAADGQEHRFGTMVEDLAEQFQLTEEEKKELLPSGRYLLFHNRVGWAKTYLTKSGLLESTRRGYFRITSRGVELLHEQPARIDIQLLQRYPEFVEFRSRAKKPPVPKVKVDGGGGAVPPEKTPQEELESAFDAVRGGVMTELLEEVSGSSWQFFERLVVDLLVSMGYGGDRRDAGRATQLTSDEGVDGLINEDRLGLDVIYLQAKKWEVTRTVGRPELQKFAGALQGKRAKKGVFITTSSFSKGAREFAATIETKIVLIDGQRLAELMYEHDVGVSTTARYDVKRLDTDYFEGG